MTLLMDSHHLAKATLFGILAFSVACSSGPGGASGQGGASGVGGGVGGSATTGAGGVAGVGGHANTTDAGMDGGAGANGAGGIRGMGGMSAMGGAAGQDAGAAGADGGTPCRNFAVSFGANVAANNDPAMARVNVPFAGSPDLPTGNASRTIEFWAYVLTSSWAADANTLFFYGTNNRVADGFGLDFGSNMGAMGTIDPFTNAIFDNDNQPSGLMVTANQWAHFAMTWDGTTVRAFVNGVQRASKAAPTTSAQKTLMTGMTALTIGGYPPAYFNGYIDEFRIWNVARSAADILSTMNHTLAGDEPGLTGYWKFDEGSGATAADSVKSAGHTAHAGTLMANNAGTLPNWVTGAPLACP